MEELIAAWRELKTLLAAAKGIVHGAEIVALLKEIRDRQTLPGKPLMTTDEVCEYLGIGKVSLRRWENSGKMPKAVQTPGGPRWRRSELEKWIGTLKPRRKTPRRKIIETDPPAP